MGDQSRFQAFEHAGLLARAAPFLGAMWLAIMAFPLPPEVETSPVLVAALGPRMLRLAGERTDGTILWMADERAIGDHIAPTIGAAAESAGRPSPRIVAGIPVCLCAEDEVETAASAPDHSAPRGQIAQQPAPPPHKFDPYTGKPLDSCSTPTSTPPSGA